MNAGVNLWLIRHGETEWSLSGAHTGRTDIPLTEHGREQAFELRRSLAGTTFALVLSSPLGRAVETCKIAGLGAQAQKDKNLLEWNYGIYEGRTTKQIREQEPDWNVWESEIKQGESINEVGVRADAVIARALTASAKNNEPTHVALFAHGHILRILGARWIGLEAVGGSHLALGTGSVSVLGWERETRVIERWNLAPQQS